MKYYVGDIFTPTSSADINYIERESLDSRIYSALRTKGKQIVIFGHSGVGKTTLLRKSLQKIYENEIISHCMKGITFESLVYDAFDKLNDYYLESKSSITKTSVKASISSNYFSIKNTIVASKESGDSENFRRMVNTQITPQRLADFLGEANCCWILEDFHKMDIPEKNKLSQIMKVFMDKSADYPALKIIALGAVNTGREVVEYDIEMRNRVSEIEVSLMKKKELKEIIDNGEKFLNIKFPNEIKDEIVDFSNGLASICHSICSYICEEAGIIMTLDGNFIQLTEENFNAGIKRYMEEETDTLKYKFEMAFNRMPSQKKNTELIFRALSVYDYSEGATENELFREILEESSRFNKKTLSAQLDRLTKDINGGVIIYNTSSRKYSFTIPLYKTYVDAYFTSNKNAYQISSNSLKNKISKIAYEAIVKEQMEKYVKNN
ncbi:hypothetical protein [Aliarcobacter butzleri]|uniref:hypothetical protein n=1 Tax=Aliarcobacter butzleri TaxID=28197 RepID=UPI002B243F48|nr:hypothetical protein [Aliarcobacter butzleri]